MDEKYAVTELADGYGFIAIVYGAHHYSCAYIIRSSGNPQKVAERNAREQPWAYGWKTREEAETAVEKHKKQFPN